MHTESKAIVRARILPSKALKILQAIALVAMAGLFSNRAQAASVTWDPSLNGSGSDGSGAWSTGNADWGSGGGDANWSNSGNTAVIGDGGTAGTITVSGGVSAAGITFSPVTSGFYDVTSGTITLTGATITTSASNAEIDSVLAGSVGLTTTGTGTLKLGGVNTFTGATVVNGGSTLVVGPGSSISNAVQTDVGNTGAGTLTIAGGSFTNSAGSPSMFVGVGGAGTFNMTSGTANFTGGYVQTGCGAAATFNQTGGLFDTHGNTFYVANSGGSPTAINLSGGTFTQEAGQMQVGDRSNSSLNISGTALVTIGNVLLGNVNAATGLSSQFNLTGGTLITSGISYSADTFTSNLNGGTLQAASSTASLWNNSASVTGTIGSSGFTVNTAGFNDTISQVFGGTGALIKTGAGTLTLSGANTFGGGVVISSGTVNFSASSNLGGSSGGVTFSGTGELQAGANNIVLPSTQTMTINPGVTGTFDTQSNTMTINGAIVGSTGSLAKISSGTLILGGVSTYGGATSINAGQITVTGTLGNTAITVNNGTDLGGTGLIGGSVTVNAGGILNLVDGSIGKLTFSNGLTIGNNTTASIMDFEGNTGGFDLLNDSAGALNVNGTTTINITPLAGGLTSGTYNLITFGSTTGSLSNLVLGSPAVAGKNLSLVTTGTSEELLVSVATAYWKGANGTSWSATGPTNWTSDIAGTTATTAPNSTTDVYFSTNGVSSPVTTSLGANFDIGSLHFNSNATGSVAITDATFGLTVEGGITVDAGTGAHSINVKSVTVNSSQAWINNSGNLFTVISSVNGAAATSATTALTLSGSGAGGMLLSGAIGNGTGGGQLALVLNAPGELVTLTGSNTYGGATTISSGTLQIGGSGVLGSGGSYAGAISNLGALIVSSSASQTLSGVISGTGAFTQAGTGATILTGNSTYTGPITVSSGTLQIGAGSTAGSLASTSITNNGSMVYSRSDTIDLTGTYTGTGSLTLNGGAGTIGIRGPINLASVTATSSYASAGGSTLYGSNYFSAINLFANVTTTGNQAYNGIVSIGRGSSPTNTLLTTTSGGSVSLPNGVLSGVSGDFSANGLYIDTSAGNGNVTLGGQSALEYGVGNLSINSGTGTITLTGGSYYYDYSVFNGNVALAGNTTFQNDGQRYVHGVTFDGNLTGAFTLTATLNGGGAAGSSGTGAQGLIFNTATTQLVSANIAGASTGSFVLTKIGAGITTFSGSNSYSGGTTISAGILEFSATNAMPSSGTVAAGNGGTLAVAVGGAGQFTTVTSGAGSIGGLLSGTGGQGAPVTWVSGAALGIDTTFGNATYAGNIANPGGNTLGLTKLGSNNLTLTGSNSYTGGTAISSGTLVLNSSANQTLSGIISGTGAFTQAGTGATILTGNNTYTGATTVGSGTLQIGAGGTTGSLASTSIVNNGSMVYSRSDTIDLTGTYTGTGSLTLNGGAGTIGIRGPINLASVTATSSFASTSQSFYGSGYASAINIFNNVTTSGNQTYNGIVSIGHGNTVPYYTSLTATGGGSISLPSGVVSGVSGYWSAGSLVIDTSAGNGNVTLGGQALAYGVGNLNVNSGSGGITLTGGYYMYDFSVFNGNISLTGSTAFESGPNAGLGTSQYVRGVTFDGNVAGPGVTLNATFGSGAASTSGTGAQGLIFNTATTQLVSANIIGTAGPTKTGAGFTTFTGTNSYSGGTTISAGTLEFSATNTMPSSGTVAAGNGGTLAVAVGGTGQFTTATSGAGSIGGLLGGTGGQGAPVTWASGAALGIDTTAASGTYTGVISNPGGHTLGLTKLGSNTLTLTAVNSYTGATAVDGGTLIVSGSLSASSAVNVVGGTLGGGGLIANNVVIGTGLGAPSSSVIEPSANGGAVGTVLTIGGNLTLSGTDAAYEFTLNSSNLGVADKLNVGGTLALGTGLATLTGLDFGGGTVPLGTQYVIATAFNVSGYFANAPQGALIGIGSNFYTIDYTAGGGEDIVLTAAVPEPGTWAMMLCGVGMLVGLQRRRRGLATK